MKRSAWLIPLVWLVAGCIVPSASPCPPYNSSINGYCRDSVAVNCRNDCGDCTDYWNEQSCTSGCSVSDVKPAQGKLASSEPALTRPTRWAVCGEWSSSPPDGGKD